MQVIECNHCGETLQAADNEEPGAWSPHTWRPSTTSGPTRTSCSSSVESEAYEAMDS